MTANRATVTTSDPAMSEQRTNEWYHRHLIDDVLAWWTEHGPDPDHGGVLTCWDNAGTRLVSTDKYTWSQGRWAWLTARLAMAGERGVLDVDADWYTRESEGTARFLRDHAMLPDRRTAYVTTRAGEPFEPVAGGGLHTSVFADLFVALGFAGLAQLRPEEDWGGQSLEILRRSAAAIASGDYQSEPYPVARGHLSFGLPMILIGVGEQVYRATGSSEAADVVRTAAAKIEDHFLTGSDITEMPRTDGNDDGSLLVRHRTPGHVLECVWFLHHARDLLDGRLLASTAALVPIADHSLEIGWDSEHGGLFRYTDAFGGEPTGSRSEDPYEALVVSTWDTKLWWPHAEALYTTALLAHTTDDPGMRVWEERVREYTLRTFPDGLGREWTQNRDRTGAPIDKTVALPVKDPFHVARALLMLAELDHDGRTAPSPTSLKEHR